MEIYVDTGSASLAGIYPFRIRCYESTCDKCILRFKCFTGRNEQLEISWDEWIEVRKYMDWTQL